ncbi:hypothetical protein SLEP1_g39252 [Rubroshorea leprosula]|uniref:Glycosyltransferase n=1 Tax=Rubroshorea leprosula TaxID=152421 RepID=A0AAV5L0C4_9ROSI|nr:hypothetical protein SLEP1_g39252 [Rubroshorea leprosula]
MASNQPHFIFIPFMAQGHLIPLMDIAKLFAEQNALVTIIATPSSLARSGSTINRAIESGLPIQVLQVRFPSTEAGLPEGCEFADKIPSPTLVKNFYTAVAMMQKPVEKLFSELKPHPNCIIYDRNFTWIVDIASKFQIPRILFDGKNYFTLLCYHALNISKVHENVSETEPFVVPGLPDRIEFTKGQLPSNFNPGNSSTMNEVVQKILAAEGGGYGVLLNTFEELEAEYVKTYRKVQDRKIWCVGPASQCNKENSDKAKRGNKSSIDENQCLEWLDSQAPNSVIYACFGSLNRLTAPQLIELGSALEATNKPFIWVLRGADGKEEMEKWFLEDGFEERTRGRGLLIRGWAPQVLILSHPAVGGFLTHCGWNSTLEGICAGLPMITWPLFSEQFFNEKLVVQVLKIGVGVGAKARLRCWGEGDSGLLVKREDIKKAVDMVMGEGEEGQERRRKSRQLADMAKKALEKGGSSYLNISLLIEDIKQQATSNPIAA